MVRGLEKDDDSLGRFAFGVFVAAALLTALVTISSVGALPAGPRLRIGQFFPEGWKLFTAPPQAARFHPVVSRQGRWQDATKLPLAKPSNAFGLNRSPRWQAEELTRLVAEVPYLNKWTPCRKRPSSCLALAERKRRIWRVPNRTPFQTLCGRVGLVRELIVPPGGQGSANRLRTTHVVVLDVGC